VVSGYAALTSSGIVCSGSAYLMRLRRWRSSWLKRMPLVSWVIRRSRTAQTSDRQLSSPGNLPHRLGAAFDFAERALEQSG